MQVEAALEGVDGEVAGEADLGEARLRQVGVVDVEEEEIRGLGVGGRVRVGDVGADGG